MLRWGTLQTVNKPRERHKVNTHNDCNFLTCPAVWLRFFLATSLVTFTLQSYKTIQLFFHSYKWRKDCQNISCFFKNIYFKILTICHHIFTFTAHGRRVRILKIRLIKIKVLKQIKRRRSKPSQSFYTSQLHGEKQGKKRSPSVNSHSLNKNNLNRSGTSARKDLFLKPN